MIYLNTASTTKVDDKVLEDFIYATKTYWQNPSDISQGGLDAKNVIEEARHKVAKSIGAKKGREIVFLSGGSEANNFAIKGYLDKHPECTTIITTEIEHASVYNTCKYLETKGYKVYYSPVDKFGCVDVNKLEELIISNKINKPFVSIMFSNNMIGSVNDIKKIIASGGILSWAHPVYSPDKLNDEFFQFLKYYGINGAEGNYQYIGADKEYVECAKKILMPLIKKFNMFMTGGTDSHSGTIFSR